MKIIDLLNKIANGEEVPKRIKEIYYIDEKKYTEEYVFNYDNNWYETSLCGDTMNIFRCDRLNDEIKIIEEEIEEEKKIPEKIDELIEIKSSDKPESIIYEICSIQRKINEIIDYLKSKESDE